MFSKNLKFRKFKEKNNSLIIPSPKDNQCVYFFIHRQDLDLISILFVINNCDCY